MGHFIPSDHGMLSPSGHVSKRSRDAALERARVELFGTEGLQRPPVPQPSEVEYLRRKASELRGLAQRGMKPRAYKRKADELDAQADAFTRVVAETKQRGQQWSDYIKMIERQIWRKRQ